jgi:hypothetical protein
MRTKRFTALAWPTLLVVCLVLAAFPAGAKILKGGFGYNNLNFAPVTVTYSWSGHFAGGGEV